MESHVLYETLADQTEPFYCFWCFISVAVTAKSSTVRCGRSLNGLSGVTQTRRRCIRKCSSVLSSVRNCRATWPSRRHQQNCRIKPIKTQIGNARICIFGIFTTSALKVAFQANLCLQCLCLQCFDTSTKFIKNNQKILYFWRFDLFWLFLMNFVLVCLIQPNETFLNRFSLFKFSPATVSSRRE